MKPILLVSFFILSLIPCLAQNQINESETVSALTIGYSPLARVEILTGNSTSYFLDDVLILVEKGSNNITKGQYIRFKYDHSNNEAKLPEQMFTKKDLWEFRLTRNQKCDVMMKDLLTYEIEGKTNSYLVFTKWAKQELLPADENVLCYTLTKDSYKKL